MRIGRKPCPVPIQTKRSNRERRKALQQVKSEHDATSGVTWETLEWAARDLFRDAPETDEA